MNSNRLQNLSRVKAMDNHRTEFPKNEEQKFPSISSDLRNKPVNKKLSNSNYVASIQATIIVRYLPILKILYF